MGQRLRQRKSVVLACADGDRGLNVESQAFSMILDPIGQELARRSIDVRSIPLTRKAKLVGELAFNTPRQFRWYENVGLIVSNRFKGRFKALGLWLGSKVWESILRECDVGVVLAVQPHGQLCRAAKRLGAAVFDVQHGQLNLESRYYGRLRQGVSAKVLRNAPDGVLCWDAISASGADSMLSIPAETIGHPGLALPLPAALGRLQNRDDLRTALRTTGSLGERPTVRKIIVAPDSWTSSVGDIADREQFLMLVARLSERHHDVLWVVRPHPVQLRGARPGNDWLAADTDYRRLLGDAPNVFDPKTAGDAPLFELLAEADGLLTRGSGTLIEASYLSVPTAVTGTSRKSLESYFDSRYLDGVTWLGTSFEQASQWVEALPARSEHRESHSRQAHQALMEDWLERVEQLVPDDLKS